MIAVVVPTIRKEQYDKFKEAWMPLIIKHSAYLITVHDGETPYAVIDSPKTGYAIGIGPHHIPSDWQHLIYNLNDGVRNFGFLLALQSLGKELKAIITLDDDVAPYLNNDPIQEHLDALQMRVPISWFSIASRYMRGFPYGVREEAEVWVSHGVWQGVHDYDGPTQLVCGNKSANFYKGPIPKGCKFACCGMSLAFKIEALPFMYFAPMGKSLGVQRFADIWMGLDMKFSLDNRNKAVVTGYSTVYHDRASNVFSNLEQEAKGIKWNEDFNKYEGLDSEHYNYREDYRKKQEQWKEIVKRLM